MPRTHNTFLVAYFFYWRIVERTTKVITNSINRTKILAVVSRCEQESPVSSYHTRATTIQMMPNKNITISNTNSNSLVSSAQ
jgi:hypothetical protein